MPAVPWPIGRTWSWTTKWALRPELTLHTDTQDVWGSLEELLRLAQRLQRAATVKDYATKPSATS